MMVKPVCDSILVTHLPNLRFLTGFTGSSGCALVTRRKKVFFTDSRYLAQARREVKVFETVVVNGSPLLGAAAYINSRQLKTGLLGYEGAYISARELAALRRALKGRRLKDASGCVEAQRMIKDRREVGYIRRACKLADLALERLRRFRVIGKTERQVAWMLEATMRKAGSGPLPFEIIVASGPRSAMPHGVAGNRVIRTGELLVVDLGATANGYCSDMTRTFATGGLSGRQQEIYETVRVAQELAVRGIRPGGRCADLDGLARDHITAAGYGEAFGHSLGHGVGLEAHELPVLSYRATEALQPGMIVTVEPGIYLERTGGVRIEDTVLVGQRGGLRLTKFPRHLISLH
ncbi:MAG: M24 family metallopeptidase [Thermoleophilia bacterium]